MAVTQLSVFLENKPGRLADTVRTLKEHAINIRALSLADTSDFGILRMIVCDPEKAKTVLKEKGFTIGRTSVVAVEVPDTAGGLDSVLQAVSEHGINVEYMYAFLGGKRADHAYMIFRVSEVREAEAAIGEQGFKALTQEEISQC